MTSKLLYFHKKAYWWRLYYYFFSDYFEGMTLKEVLNEDYGQDKDNYGFT